MMNESEMTTTLKKNAYFNNAATTFPKPECVYDFMNDFYRTSGGNAGRGNNDFSLNSSKLIFETRKKIKELLNCEGKKVVFTPSATFALNMIIQGLILSKTENVKNVYISPFEHNAVTRVLHHFEKNGKINVLQFTMTKNCQVDFERLKNDFENVKPDLLICTHVSNVTGLVLPVEKICELAKNYGAKTVIDMAQSCGLIDLDCQNQNIDFAVFAGHKTLYGPTGIGGFVMNPQIDLQPVFFGGTGVESLNQEMPKDIPSRFEMGTQNILGIAGLHAALCWIEKIGLEKLWQKEKQNRNRLLKIFEEFDFIRVVGNYPENEYAGIVSVLIEGIPSDSAESIFNERGIAVRSGLQCSPFAHKFLGTSPSGTVRFSTGYFTSEEEFLMLEKVLGEIGEEI